MDSVEKNQTAQRPWSLGAVVQCTSSINCEIVIPLKFGTMYTNWKGFMLYGFLLSNHT